MSAEKKEENNKDISTKAKIVKFIDELSDEITPAPINIYNQLLRIS